jgi:hypothetical protein
MFLKVFVGWYVAALQRLGVIESCALKYVEPTETSDSVHRLAFSYTK